MGLVGLLVLAQYLVADLDLFNRLLGLALKQVQRLQVLAAPPHDHIVQLLEQNNYPSRATIELGVGPEQANRVEHGIEQFAAKVEVSCFQRFEEALQGHQMGVDVLGLFQGSPRLGKQVVERWIVAAVCFL